jgi:aminoglycoside phosphotransferase (APT) family kinase protein
MTDLKSEGQLVDAGIVAPNQRDFGDLETVLREWLLSRLKDAVDLKIDNFSYPRGAGLSHETILFDAYWTERDTPRMQGMVIRIKPTEHTVYQHDWFIEQYRIMAALKQANATPIATPLWLELDPGIVGAPFFVMEKRVGKVPVSFPPYSREGWVTELSVSQRRLLWENAIYAFAGIQSLPLSEATFLDPDGRYPDGFEQEWDRWRSYFDWARKDQEFTFLDEVWAKLQSTRPKSRQPGLVWGDARIGNIMFDDQMNVAAVMDWEAPGIGGALHDLGYWTVMSQLETAQQGLPMLDGMGSREETIALWGELAGIDTSEIEWYERFAALKMSCLAIRTLALRPFERPGMNRFDNPPVRVLAEWYDLPVPTPKEEHLISRPAAPVH